MILQVPFTFASKKLTVSGPIFGGPLITNSVRLPVLSVLFPFGLYDLGELDLLDKNYNSVSDCIELGWSGKPHRRSR